MIGILRKDVYMLLAAYGKNLLLTFLLYGVMTLVLNNPVFPAMLVWVMGLCSLSAITMDEADGWDRYARTLPVSPEQIVAARYLAALGMIAAASAFALGLGAAGSLCGKSDFTPHFTAVSIAAGTSLPSIGLLLPAAYKWGVEKARNGFLLLFAAIFVTPFLLKNAMGEAFFRSALARLEETPVPLLTAAVPAAGLLLFALGALLACRIYRRKEF